MIECLRDADGNITGACEWLLFNEQGQLDEKGQTVFIGEFEINPIHRGKGVIRDFIRAIYKANPEAKRVFWFREHKYPGRKPKMYDVNRFKGV